jgi:ectoine hydroxylase-related dioxygenase (phytanoyl-CoA dioxygenase family)
MRNTLSGKDVALYRRQGFLGPFELCTPKQMREHRSKLEQVLASPGPTSRPVMFRHFDSQLTYELCSHPAVLGRITSILGPDLVFWHSSFFEKPPGDVEVPWHQDGHFWPLDPVVNVTAWIAIEDATRDNGCLEFSPGSHEERIPHVKFATSGRFRERADPHQLRISNPVQLEVKAGQFILFDAWVLHRSAANFSAQRRLALSARLTTPTVTIDSSRYFTGYKAISIRHTGT